MRYRGQTSIEYLILLAGVMLIVLVAGYGVLSSADVGHTVVQDIHGADVSPPEVVLRESDVPPPHIPDIGTPAPPPKRHPPNITDCSLLLLPDPPEIGGTATVSYTAEDVGGDLQRVEVSVYLEGSLVESDAISISGYRYDGTYTYNISDYGHYEIVVTVYDSYDDWVRCTKQFDVSEIIYFGDCNAITYWLGSDVVKKAADEGRPILLVQKNDILAEPLPSGRPREACIYAGDYDYGGHVKVSGNGYVVYIAATGSEYNAHRAVYLRGVEGLVFEGMQFDCASMWKAIRERGPCVDLHRSSATFVGGKITDFGTSVSGAFQAVPVRLQDSGLWLDGEMWIKDLDDKSIIPNWQGYTKNMSNAFFVLVGGSELNISPNAVVMLEAQPDS